MEPSTLFVIFVLLRLAQEGAENWLAWLNYRYYMNPQNQNAARQVLGVTEEDLGKSIRYANDKLKFGLISGWIQLVAFLVFVALGGLGFLEDLAQSLAGPGSPILSGLAFFAVLGLISTVFSVPFDFYRVFVIEDKHGFNKQTPRIFFIDKLKGLVLGALIGSLMLSALLWVMGESGSYWWVGAWLVVMAISLITAWIYPTLLAPIFNRFEPLSAGDLKDKIEALAKRIGFSTSGIFVMNASLRSSHGNAYFTGMFGKKRIVLFDTLIEAMSAGEVVAVLAHELGHFKLHHVRWGLIRGFIMTGVMFFLLSLCLPLEGFYLAFGLQGVSNYGALITFSLWYGPIAFALMPISTWMSRRNEFAADDFAKQNLGGDASELASALLKLREKSSSLPVYHPLYSSIYHSHPPMMERLKAMQALGRRQSA